MADKRNRPISLGRVRCNSFKGSDISSIDPVTDNLTPLFSPRLDDWNEHFRYKVGSIIPLTPIGRVTVKNWKISERVAAAHGAFSSAASFLKYSWIAFL
jgi:hypothetical protein